MPDIDGFIKFYCDISRLVSLFSQMVSVGTVLDLLKKDVLSMCTPVLPWLVLHNLEQLGQCMVSAIRHVLSITTFFPSERIFFFCLKSGETKVSG